MLAVENLGDHTGLLHVGEASELRPQIEAELGPVATAPGRGHDGQVYYAIARDPFATGATPDLMDDPGYRYRRILYPALAGGLGSFSPKLTLFLMIGWGVAALGMIAAAVHVIARRMNAAWWAPLAATINLGAFLALWNVTADALALGLALGAVAFFVAGRREWSLPALALAALTKDTYLLFALGLAIAALPDRRWAIRLAVLPAVPLLAWSAWVTTAVGGGFTPRGNLSAPFAGLVEAAGRWSGTPADEVRYLAITLVILVLAVVVAARVRNPLITATALPWVVLAVMSSRWVWLFGNNALRAFSPLWALAGLGLAVYASESTSRRNLPV